MEDKRYDPYTGYEIKDEDSTQEYHTQDDDSYRRYRYEDDHIEQPQQEQTSGIAIATMILGIIAVVCMVSCCCTPIRNYHWDCSGHLFCGDTKSQEEQEEIRRKQD